MKYNILINGKKSFNYQDSAIGEIVYIVIENLILVLLSILLALKVPRTATLSYIFSFLVEVGFVAAVFISARISKTAVVEATGLNKKITVKQALFVVLLCVICLIGFSPITTTFSDFLTNVGYSSNTDISVNSWGTYFLFLFTMAIVPAFCEELLFRGLIYNGLKKWNSTGALFVSAALFMLMHGSPDQTVHQFFLGLVLALVFSCTGSLWAPMLLHFLNNFIALTSSFIYAKRKVALSTEVVKTPWGQWALYGLFAIFFTAFVCYIIIAIIKYLKKDRETREAIQTQNQVAEVVIEKPQEDGEQQEPVEISVSTPFPNPTLSIVLYALSGVILVANWLSALIQGF